MKPAVEGTLRVLRAAAAATPRPRRVVLTSSISSIAYGHPRDDARVFTEADWTDVANPSVPAYQKSKTLAERAAWDFVQSLPESAGLELVAINPAFVAGPVLSGTYLIHVVRNHR